jgi:hypothetical protein
VRNPSTRQVLGLYPPPCRILLLWHLLFRPTRPANSQGHWLSASEVWRCACHFSCLCVWVASYDSVECLVWCVGMEEVFESVQEKPVIPKEKKRACPK